MGLAIWIFLIYVAIAIGTVYLFKNDIDYSSIIIAAIFWPILAVILLFIIIFEYEV